MTIRPDEIATTPNSPFVLDGCVFVPQPYEGEMVIRCCHVIGELGIDEENNTWRARKGEGDWRPMRCRAEARAFLVSKCAVWP